MREPHGRRCSACEEPGERERSPRQASYRFEKNAPLRRADAAESKIVDLTEPAQAAKFERCRETMAEILRKKKVSSCAAEKVIEQALDAAADHQLERLRHNRFVHDIERSRKDLRRLKNTLIISRKRWRNYRQSPLAKSTKLSPHQDWQHFDAELFFEHHARITGCTVQPSPARTAEKARSFIRESLELPGTVRSAKSYGPVRRRSLSYGRLFRPKRG